MNDSTIMAYARMAGEDGDRIERLSTDLAACRARLAALVAAASRLENAATNLWERADFVRAWYAARPDQSCEDMTMLDDEVETFGAVLEATDPAMDAARDWLRAHPAEGGQDADH